MKTLALLTAILLLVPASAEARAKKRKHAARPASAQQLTAQQRDKQRAQQARVAEESARAEAELSEVRSGRIASPTAADRDFPTQQSDDAEKPPGAPPR